MQNNTLQFIKDLNKKARGQLIGRYNVAIFVIMTVAFIQFIVLSMTDGAYTGSITSYLLRIVISIIVDLLTGALIFGKSQFFLNLVRGVEPITPKDMFAGFKSGIIDKAICVQAFYTVISLITSIPSVLLSLGMFQISYEEYRSITAIISLINIVFLFIEKLFIGLSFYILSDNPEMSVPEVIKKSFELMQNKKGRLVLIYLSSLPLLLLSICAFFIGCLWFLAYFEALLANFYLNAIGEEPSNPFTKPEASSEPTPEA